MVAARQNCNAHHATLWLELHASLFSSSCHLWSAWCPHYSSLSRSKGVFWRSHHLGYHRFARIVPLSESSRNYEWFHLASFQPQSSCSIQVQPSFSFYSLPHCLLSLLKTKACSVINHLFAAVWFSRALVSKLIALTPDVPVQSLCRSERSCRERLLGRLKTNRRLLDRFRDPWVHHDSWV